MKIRLAQLYPRDMNIYGDWGNVLTLIRRLQWHGYDPVLADYNHGDAFPEDVDIVLGGGGQDSGQARVHADLLGLGPRLRGLAEDGTPMLVVCGLYQLFGHAVITSDGTTMPGIGVLDTRTDPGDERLIGNVVIQSPQFGEIVGYENHSGRTFLGEGVEPLGTVRQGAGNNGQDGTEGVRHRHVIGSYLHGTLLPRNPRLADFLIAQAVERRYGQFTPAAIDDRDADEARRIAKSRPR